MKARYQFVVVLGLLAQAVLSSGAELAILRNGNSIRHLRRQNLGAVTRLYLSDADSGYIEIPTDQIERFEIDTTPSPPTLASPPAPASGPQATTMPAPQPISPKALNPKELNEVVAGAGERHQLDPDFINSVIRAESGFRPFAVSKKGAQGLMQLMPGTASQLGVGNAFDPNSNVEAGTKYLRDLLEMYNFDVAKALAAYNAGPNRVARYHGIPPYYETQAYISRIIRDYNRQKLAENPGLARKSKPAARNSETTKAHGRRSDDRNSVVTKSISENPQTAVH